MNDDWRLTNQEKYLKNCELELTQFESHRNSDHKHCSFCWDKFSENAEDLHFGYVANKKYWICPNCFNDFKEMFGWKVIEG